MSKRQGAKVRHKGWAIDRAAGMTYEQIARKSRPRVSTMAVYYALNPDKRIPPPPKGSSRVTRPYSTRLAMSVSEHAAVKARAKQEGMSVMALARAILFDRLPAFTVLEGESQQESEEG